MMILPVLCLALAGPAPTSAFPAASPPVAPAQREELDALAEGIALARRRTPTVQVVEAAHPAVVIIETGTEVRSRAFFGSLRARTFNGSGTGVVILKEGFIVTNYHVVENATRITVRFDESLDEAVYPAQVVSFVQSEDLALLKIEGEREFPTVPLGTSSDLMIGEPVIAIGNPFGQTLTVSTGIVSGLHRNVPIPARGLYFDDLIQTDASINFGNSGGPLLNINGKLIGINSAMNAQAENIGFAIPVDRVRVVLEDQLLSPDASRAWLGFEVSPDDRLLISKVFESGPAANTGLRQGNRILAINGQPVRSHDEYRLARLQLAPGSTVRITVSQQGREREMALDTWDKSNGVLFERLGMTVEEIGLNRGRVLVTVRSVAPAGPALELGLRPGDWIDAIRIVRGDGEQPWRIASKDALAKLISALAPGAGVVLAVFRDLTHNGAFERSELLRGEVKLD